MQTSIFARFAPVALLLAALLSPHPMRAEPTPATPTPAQPILIVNFTEQVPDVYGYGTWQNNFAVSPKNGFRVQGGRGAQGDGGMCQKIDPSLNLSSCAYIEIALAVQGGNEVPAYNVALADADGTVAAARVQVAQIMPGQPVWFRLKLTDFVVSTRPDDHGKDGKLDWSAIAQWHLQGDWVTKKPVQMLFIAIRGRP